MLFGSCFTEVCLLSTGLTSSPQAFSVPGKLTVTVEYSIDLALVIGSYYMTLFLFEGYKDLQNEKQYFGVTLISEMSKFVIAVLNPLLSYKTNVA